MTPGLCKSQTNVLKQVAAARKYGNLRRGLSSLILVGNHDLKDNDLFHYLADVSSASESTEPQPGCGAALRHLTINACARLTSESLLHIARYAPNLESLHLKDLYIDEDHPESPSHLAMLLSSLPHLREVALSGLSLERSSASLLTETKVKPSLTQLSLVNMPDITSKHLLCFPHLQHLHISRCPWIRGVPVNGPKGLQELRTLIFVGSPGSFVRSNIFAESKKAYVWESRSRMRTFTASVCWAKARPGDQSTANEAFASSSSTPPHRTQVSQCEAVDRVPQILDATAQPRRSRSSSMRCTRERRSSRQHYRARRCLKPCDRLKRCSIAQYTGCIALMRI